MVPDLAERRTFACGPGRACSTRSQEFHDNKGLQLFTEQFRTARVEPGDGGTVGFTDGRTVDADGATPILDAAEAAGVLMPSGCRMGICYGCVLPLREGSVRDLRNGADHHRRARRERRDQGPDLHQRRRRRLPPRPPVTEGTHP